MATKYVASILLLVIVIADHSSAYGRTSGQRGIMSFIGARSAHGIQNMMGGGEGRRRDTRNSYGGGGEERRRGFRNWFGGGEEGQRRGSRNWFGGGEDRQRRGMSGGEDGQRRGLRYFMAKLKDRHRGTKNNRGGGDQGQKRGLSNMRTKISDNDHGPSYFSSQWDDSHHVGRGKKNRKNARLNHEYNNHMAWGEAPERDRHWHEYWEGIF